MAYRPNQPEYYTRGNVPVWDFIHQQGLNFDLGNVIKYVCRAGHKGSEREDIKKAINYLEHHLTNIDKSSAIPTVPFGLSDPEWEELTRDADRFDR